MSLSVKSLVKSYSGRKVVDDVSFEVQKGEVYGILGRNGAGKTTIIKMILDIISKDFGEVLLDGCELDVIKNKVGYLAEERSLYSDKKVREQLMYFAMLSGLKFFRAKKEVDYWIEKFHLENFSDKPLHTLSKGNQQKVQIIATIVNDPEVIVFDEPFSGLDPVNSELLRDVVLDFINRGKYILFCSHQMFYIEEFCDRISIMKNGKQCIEGKLFDVKNFYGRKKLILEIGGHLPDLNIYGVEKISKNKNFYELDILNENIANNILGILINNRVKIYSFDLKQRSLHEIFIEMAGD